MRIPGRNIHVATVVTAAIGFLFATGLWRWVDHLSRRSLVTRFEAAAEERIHALRAILSRDAFFLEAVSDFFQASGAPDQAAFHRFCAQGVRRHPETTAIEWAPRVLARDLAAFEARQARDLGLPGFRVRQRIPPEPPKPATARESYYPILWVEPKAGHEVLAGLDLDFNPPNRRAIADTLWTTRPVMGRGRPLVKAPGDNKLGALFFKAVPGHDGPRGLLALVLHFDTLARTTFSPFPSDEMDLSVSEIDTGQAPRMLFHWPPEPTGTPAAFAPVVWNVEVGGATWRLSMEPSQAFVDRNRTLSPLWSLALGSILALLGAAYVESVLQRSRIVKAQVEAATRDLRSAQGELQAVNASLEQRVAQAVAHNLEQERALILQSRLASMGEMIRNIAHQWRQPLNALGFLLGNLADPARQAPPSAAEVAETVVQGNLLLQKMSMTINDFRDFLRPDKAAEAFSVRRQAAVSIALVAATFKHTGIDLRLLEGEDVFTTGSPNAYSQAVLNLLGNAREAILERKVAGGWVEVEAMRLEARCLLRVRDNGGGIPQGDLARIFEPYFSTKQEGTGLGLYLSRTLLQRGFAGTLDVRNLGAGAEFTIATPAVEVPDGID